MSKKSYPSKQIREIHKTAKKYGWTWELTGSGNVRWISPTGKVVICGASPSYRSVKNTLANLHAAGLPR